MKKLFTFGLITLFTAQIFAQDNYTFIGIGADPAKLISGSSESLDKPAADITFKLGYHFGRQEAGSYIEAYNSATPNLNKFAIYYQFDTVRIKSFSLAIGPEVTGFTRTDIGSYFSYGANAEVRYVFKNLATGLQFNFTGRPDWNDIHTGSKKNAAGTVFLNLYYLIR